MDGDAIINSEKCVDTNMGRQRCEQWVEGLPVSLAYGHLISPASGDCLNIVSLNSEGT